MTDLETRPDAPVAAPVASPAPESGAEPAASAVPAVQAVDMSAVVNRVKRAQGQLGGVLRMIEEGRDLEAVVHQLKAVSRALDRAGFALIAAELRQTVADGADVGEPELAKLEKFFLSLA
ncbi:metal-sensitive transcriptional regulator [Nocardioides abyssi]|uniref:metal-sensitive transcriptional regulator n=1 Tax=Nocardioides abyssi TaxID=3058370 RepID=UPI003F6B6770